MGNGVIPPEFWSATSPLGSQLRAVGLEAKLVAAYLLTGPHKHTTGIYSIEPATISREAGVQKARKALRALEEVGFAFYDDREGIVYVPDLFRYDFHGKALDPKDKNAKYFANHLARYTESRFFPLLMARHPSLRAAFDAPSARRMEGEEPEKVPSESLRASGEELRLRLRVAAPADLTVLDRIGTYVRAFGLERAVRVCERAKERVPVEKSPRSITWFETPLRSEFETAVRMAHAKHAASEGWRWSIVLGWHMPFHHEGRAGLAFCTDEPRCLSAKGDPTPWRAPHVAFVGDGWEDGPGKPCSCEQRCPPPPVAVEVR